MTRTISMLLCSSPIFAMMAGCATISEKSCRYDSWHDIGYSAAMKNADHADHISDVDKICGKLGIIVDYDQYKAGFAEGTRDFCVPANGFQWGLKGNIYNGVCANPAFNAAYDDGHHIYKIEQRKMAITNRLESIRGRLDKIATQLDEDKTLTDEQRRKLQREYDNLMLERKDLLSEQRSLPIY
jgi:Protein of unknown function (DUF2799)